MSPKFALLAFDTAVNMGVSRVNQFMKAAQWKYPEKFIAARRAKYEEFAQYGNQKIFLQGWLNRLKALENEIINPGEGKSIKLVLFKQMTEENTGIVSNSAEIAETFNEEGIEDIDSVPGNGLDNEDDLGTADIVISVETGGTFISGAVFVVFVIVALVGVYIFKKNVLERVRRW